MSIYPLINGRFPMILPIVLKKGTGLFLCGYCGQEMIEILMHKGGRGYDWVKICPDRCHPDKYDKQSTLEV